MRERNVQNCVDECSECNPGLPADAERRETVRAVHIRSWRNCLEVLVRMQQIRLNAQEPEEVWTQIMTAIYILPGWKIAM